jgi:glycosyltransferase involved in cell wall biosynthesis
MHVLVLHSELGVLRGGGENFTRNLFSAFAARGHNVTAVFVADRRARYPLPLPPRIQPIPLPGWWSRNLGQGLFSTFGHHALHNAWLTVWRDRLQDAVSWRVARWHNRRFQRRVEATLSPRFGQFEAAFVHGDVNLAAKMAHHLPTVLRLPGPVSPDSARLLRQVHVVCANGDALARVRSFLGPDVMELPIGIDAAIFRPGSSYVRQRFHWSATDLVLGYVGRLTHLKGVDILATAFRTLSRCVGRLKLLVVGRGEAEKAIRSRLSEEIATGRVQMEADVEHEQLGDWYRAMDLFVMPSRYENYSNALLEAMACGIPFVASAVGGNRSLADTRSGWVFQPDSASALVSCLGAIVDDSSELRVRGRNASAYVRGRFNWDRSAERLEALILSCVGIKA